MEEAVMCDNLDMLMDLHETTGNDALFLLAIQRGNLNIIRYLSDCRTSPYYVCYNDAITCSHEHVVDLFLSFSWPVDYCNIACAILELKDSIVLKLIKSNPYMITRDATITSDTIRMLLNTHKRRDCTSLVISVVLILEDYGMNKEYCTDIIYLCVIKEILLVKFLHEHDFPYNSDLYDVCRDIDTLKYLHEVINIHVDKEDESAVMETVSRGNIACFEYLVCKGFLVTEDAISTALYTDNLEMVKHLHENNYKWDTQFNTVDIENLDVRRYCHDNDIPNKWICPNTCIYCLNIKIEKLEELWQLEECTYNSIIQWPPRELLEDLCELVRV